MSKSIKIAIFASGGGSNAEAIIQHFKGVEAGEISLIVSSNPEAFVIVRADTHMIPCHIHQSEEMHNGALLKLMEANGIDFIVLAGYVKKLSDDLIAAYPNRIVNIHPSLLPKFGGKGMYGMKVHEAVVAAGEKETGITIHYVNERYDEGTIIEQHKCDIFPEDSVEDVQRRVLSLEHKYYSAVIERLIKEL